MWGKRKRVADSESPNLQMKEPTKGPPAMWERTPKTNNTSIGPIAAAAERVTSRLGASLRMKGEISGKEDLHVDGEFEGLIRLGEGKMTVGAAAKLTADIFAREVVVYGRVKGNVCAQDKIEIKKEGSLTGNLTMAQIVIEDGAQFKGSIEIERSGEKEADRNVFPPAA